MSYEIFEHTADVGIRVRAAALADLLADAARGLFSLIVANLDAVQPVQEVEFRIAGQQPDDLLFDWLAELLYTFETRRLLFSDFRVDGGRVRVDGRRAGRADRSSPARNGYGSQSDHLPRPEGPTRRRHLAGRGHRGHLAYQLYPAHSVCRLPTAHGVCRIH